MLTQSTRIMIAATALLLSSNSLAVPPTYTFQTGLGNDDVGDNSDSFYYLTGSALLSKGLSRNSIVDLRAELSTIDYSDNSDRSGEEIFVEGIYSYTPRAGFRVPTYSLGLRHLEEVLSSNDLDASTTTLLLYLSYRLNDRSSVLGGMQLGDRNSSDDSETTSYFVSYDYRFTPKWLLYTTLNLADEEIEAGSGGASSTGPNIAVRSFFSGGHLPSEGGGSGSVGGDSDNTFITVGASYVIDSVNTLDLSLNRREYDTSAGTVSGNVYSVDFFHRF